MPIFKRVFILAVVIFSVAFIFPPQKAMACTYGYDQLGYFSYHPNDTCYNLNNGATSQGVAYYSCGTNNQGFYCHFHTYTCDAPCGANGAGGGSGGGACGSSPGTIPQVNYSCRTVCGTGWSDAANNECGGCSIYKTCCSQVQCVCDPNSWGVCSQLCGAGVQTNACGNQRSCNVQSCAVNPWWQVTDGDVSTNGALNSSVPAANYLEIEGAGGYPGIPSYVSTNVSSFSQTTNWNAAAVTNLNKIYDYNLFLNKVPSDVTFANITSPLTQGTIDGLTTLSPSYKYGYYWLKYNGLANGGFALATSGNINVGNKSIILFVDSADFNINGQINVNGGIGFFMSIVGNNISVDPNVGGTATPNLEGIYFAGNTFSTGTFNAAATNPDKQLIVRGSVAATLFNLKRDMGSGNITPAQKFIFAPDQIMLYPSKLGERRMKWKEVNP